MRIRTADLLITNQLLYQLSYAGLRLIHILRKGKIGQDPPQSTSTISPSTRCSRIE